MQTFKLFRTEDPSGVSGVGYVAEGIQFSSGKCVLAWTTEHKSIAVYDSMADLVAIHGHDGKTHVRWLPDLLVGNGKDIAAVRPQKEQVGGPISSPS